MSHVLGIVVLVLGSVFGFRVGRYIVKRHVMGGVDHQMSIHYSIKLNYYHSNQYANHRNSYQGRP